MKTAVSIPDPLFEAAEQAARRLAVSRSELYATAIREYLAARRDEAVTERLNQVYTDQPAELDPAVARMQYLSLGDATW